MKKIDIERIKDLIKKNKIRWTNHVIIRLFQRHITQVDVEKAIINGEIIEVCKQCGEISYSDSVAKQLEKLVNSVRNVITEITIINYTEMVA